MRNLLTLQYWFNSRPNALEGGAQKFFLVFLLALLIGCFVFQYLKTKKKGPYLKTWKKLQSFSVTNLIIGLFLLFFTYELVPFLSARILFLIWGMGMIVWLVLIGRTFFEIPKIKEEKIKEQEFKKYVP